MEFSLKSFLPIAKGSYILVFGPSSSLPYRASGKHEGKKSGKHEE